MPVIKVNGTVSQVTNDRYQILKFWETYDFKGQERHRIWTAWFDNNLPSNIAEGDWVEIEGSLGTKVSTYKPKDSDEDKSIVEHSLNEVALRQHKPKTSVFAHMANGGDSPIVTDETPF